MEEEREEEVVQNTAWVILNYYREKYELCQEDICNGVCPVAALSRLEAGIRQIDSLTCETLLSRIGKEINQFEIMLDDTDYANWLVREKLLKEIGQKTYHNFEKLLADYEKIMDKSSNLQEQFYLYCQIKYMFFAGKEERNIYEKIQKAEKCTAHKIRKKQLYSRIEFELIFLDYTIYRKLRPDEAEKTEKNLLQLYANLENYNKLGYAEEIQRKILEELADAAEENEQWEKVFHYIEKLIDMAREKKQIHLLGDYYVRKLKTEEQHFQRKGMEWIEQAAEECQMAYQIFLFRNKTEQAEKIKKYCEEKLQCPIIKQEWL